MPQGYALSQPIEKSITITQDGLTYQWRLTDEVKNDIVSRLVEKQKQEIVTFVKINVKEKIFDVQAKAQSQRKILDNMNVKKKYAADKLKITYLKTEEATQKTLLLEFDSFYKALNNLTVTTNSGGSKKYFDIKSNKGARANYKKGLETIGNRKMSIKDLGELQDMMNAMNMENMDQFLSQLRQKYGVSEQERNSYIQALEQKQQELQITHEEKLQKLLVSLSASRALGGIALVEPKQELKEAFTNTAPKTSHKIAIASGLLFVALIWYSMSGSTKKREAKDASDKIENVQQDEPGIVSETPEQKEKREKTEELVKKAKTIYSSGVSYDQITTEVVDTYFKTKEYVKNLTFDTEESLAAQLMLVGDVPVSGEGENLSFEEKKAKLFLSFGHINHFLHQYTDLYYIQTSNGNKTKNHEDNNNKHLINGFAFSNIIHILMSINEGHNGIFKVGKFETTNEAIYKMMLLLGKNHLLVRQLSPTRHYFNYSPQLAEMIFNNLSITIQKQKEIIQSVGLDLID